MIFRKDPWQRIYRNLDNEGGGGATTTETAATDGGKAAKTEGKAATETAAKTTEKASAATDATTTAAPAFDWGKWADGLSDEGKKAYAKNFKSHEDLLDGALNLRKEISTRIKVPGKDASPEETAAFRKAIGAAEKPEDYKAATPEGYEMGEMQTALLGAMQKAAHETGVPAASFESFTKTYFEMEKAVQEKVEAEVDQYRRDNEVAMKKEFGADYEKLMAGAKLFVDQRLNVPEFTSLLEDKITWNGVSMQLGSHPAVVKMLAQIGQRTAEDGVIGYNSPAEKEGLRAQIAKLENEHPIGQRTKAVDAQIAALYGKLYD
jgi:hypothetical protein